MWKLFFALTFAFVVFVGWEAWAAATAQSGVETMVKTFHGKGDRGIGDHQFKVVQPPANGAARVAISNVSTGTGKSIRIAQVFYKSKPGFVGTDSFTLQTTNRDGSAQNITLSVNVR